MEAHYIIPPLKYEHWSYLKELFLTAEKKGEDHIIEYGVFQ